MTETHSDLTGYRCRVTGYSPATRSLLLRRRPQAFIMASEVLDMDTMSTCLGTNSMLGNVGTGGEGDGTKGD